MESNFDKKFLEKVVTDTESKMRVSVHSLGWDFDIPHSKAKDLLLTLEQMEVIGPAYVDHKIDIKFHDVIASNTKVNMSSGLELLLFKFKTGFQFSRYLWMVLTNKLKGKRFVLDIVSDICDTESKKLGFGVKYAINSDGEFKEYEVIGKGNVSQKQMRSFRHQVIKHLDVKEKSVTLSDNKIIIQLAIEDQHHLLSLKSKKSG